MRSCPPAGLSRCTPASSCPVLSAAGLHPAHALQGCRTPQETAAGAKGKRAPLLHTMLPRLGRFQNSPLLNPPALQKMLTYLLPFYSFQIRRRLHPALLNPSCYTTTTPPPQKQNRPEYCCYVKVENSLLRFKRCTEGS